MNLGTFPNKGANPNDRKCLAHKHETLAGASSELVLGKSQNRVLVQRGKRIPAITNAGTQVKRQRNRVFHLELDGVGVARCVASSSLTHGKEDPAAPLSQSFLHTPSGHLGATGLAFLSRTQGHLPAMSASSRIVSGVQDVNTKTTTAKGRRAQLPYRVLEAPSRGQLTALHCACACAPS